jgi:hypothetical protein
MKISKNFRLSEFISSETAKKLGIDNTPSFETMFTIKRLVEEVLQPIRDEFGMPITINSGYRCSKLNKAVGGAKNSDHVWGSAADIDSSDNKKLWNIIIKMINDGKIECRQLIDEKNLSWIHISINCPNAAYKKNQILTL